MKLTLIQNKEYHDFYNSDLFENVIEYPNEKIFQTHHEDVIPEFEWILQQLSLKAINSNALVISNLLIDDSENAISDKIGYHFSAFDLALHIRFDQNKDIRHLPIVILSFKKIDEIIADSYELPQILGTPGTFIVNPNSLSVNKVKTWVTPPLDYLFDETKFIEPNLKTIQELIGNCTKYEIADKEAEILKRLYIKNQATSGHDIANEWGAYRMAQVAGLDKSKFTYPKTLYFKYLLANIHGFEDNHQIQNFVPFYEGDLKILFIDDYFKKGWEECLKGIFNERIINNGQVSFISKSIWNDSDLADIENDVYDLILLDYYLANNERGIDKLAKIKAINPVIPVIMFTASNKAWNMDKLYEAGADGYYVKEHPETSQDLNFSNNNLSNFYESINKCLKKGVLLRKYWKKIREIQPIPILNKIDLNGNLQKNKERIIERLIMFVGLLKKAFEQTDFDKNTFFYSEWELSFLTLWSTFNELQEVYYDKTKFSFIDNSGTIITEHTNRYGTPKPEMPKVNEWKLRVPLHFIPIHLMFIEYDFSFIYDGVGNIDLSNGYYKYNLKNKSILLYDSDSSTGDYYKFNQYGSRSVNVSLEKTLHSQIAFILLNFNANNVLLRNLKHLNEFRNHLFLTHGEDSSNSDFSKIYKEQRKLDSDPKKSDEKWQNKISQLFEIVYFLCTGQECVW